MKLKPLFACLLVGIYSLVPVFSQTHTSVNLNNQVYHVLEQAEMRGLCSPLSGARPYNQDIVIAAINEILSSDNSTKLNAAERVILEQYRDSFAKPKTGIDWRKGSWYNETSLGKNEMLLSANMGVGANVEGSAGLYAPSNENHVGAELWLQAYLNGDIGSRVSYGFSAEGGLMKIPRKRLGSGNTYYAGFKIDPDDDPNGEYFNQKTTVYSEPLTHFPYSYKKRWDGSVYFLSNLGGYESWPNTTAGGYNILSELSSSFLDNKLILRLGRISREWGTGPLSSSLVFNQMARPFLGIEGEFAPFSWFSIASLTGVLEYNNTEGIKESAMNDQNVFSATMLQFSYKNYVFFDFIDTVVWPKRFEIGYIAPIINSFLYQNNIGDFDNMAITFNLKLQYPGLGHIWFSLFVDEVKLDTYLWDLDRTMTSAQAGLNISLPILSFSSIRLSYTAVNPYCYSHNRNINPWFGSLPMETSYTSNGVSLGYYIPPNSDEFLLRFKTMPVKNLVTFLQYQMIRHGAAYGTSEVDGSSLLSELAPYGRETNPVLKRFFLHDGAYQWMHIIKAGAEYNLPNLPITLYGEAGINYSFFTNTERKANSGSAYPYSVINTSEYPKSTGFIIVMGVKVFPR
jgi:hypothetical protein